MKVICAPDSFKGSLTAVDAAAAMAAGIERAIPRAIIDRCPVGDGGEGTLEAILASVDGESIWVDAADVFGKPVRAKTGMIDHGRVAIVESAAVIGLGALPAARRNVMRASSFGVGKLIMNAGSRGPEKIVVGVGGTATNDGGCGMAQAMGAQFFDRAGNGITDPMCGGMLQDIGRIDVTAMSKLPDSLQLEIASDVDNTLTGPHGAARVYAAQKGASVAQIETLDDGLRHLAAVLRHDLGIDIELLPGAGAGGGLAAGLVAFLGARIVSGIGAVLGMVRFDARVAEANLCLTGEGCFDDQSLQGKACIGVARMAATHAVPTIVLAGKKGPGITSRIDPSVSGVVAIGRGLSDAESMRRAGTLLADAACRVARKYA